MVEGKPYRYGLIAAGLCVAAVGLFIMTQERPHIYTTMCILGVSMVCVGTVWSLCQCYPKVTLTTQIQEKGEEDLVCTSAGEKEQRKMDDDVMAAEEGGTLRLCQVSLAKSREAAADFSPRPQGAGVTAVPHCTWSEALQDRDRAPLLNNLLLDDNITHTSC